MDWLQAIEKVGFPIVCVLALGWFIYWRENKHSAERAELVVSVKDAVGEAKTAYKEHKEEYKKVAETMAQSQKEDAVAKTKLADSLDGMQKTISRVQCIDGSGRYGSIK